MGMKVLKSGTISTTTTINLDEPLDPSKYMVSLSGGISGVHMVGSYLQWDGGQPYFSNKTSTSVTINVPYGTVSYEIIQKAK